MSRTANELADLIGCISLEGSKGNDSNEKLQTKRKEPPEQDDELKPTTPSSLTGGRSMTPVKDEGPIKAQTEVPQATSQNNVNPSPPPTPDTTAQKLPLQSNPEPKSSEPDPGAQQQTASPQHKSFHSVAPPPNFKPTDPYPRPGLLVGDFPPAKPYKYRDRKHVPPSRRRASYPAPIIPTSFSVLREDSGNTSHCPENAGAPSIAIPSTTAFTFPQFQKGSLPATIKAEKSASLSGKAYIIEATIAKLRGTRVIGIFTSLLLANKRLEEYIAQCFPLSTSPTSSSSSTSRSQNRGSTSPRITKRGPWPNGAVEIVLPFTINNIEKLKILPKPSSLSQFQGSEAAFLATDSSNLGTMVLAVCTTVKEAWEVCLGYMEDLGVGKGESVSGRGGERVEGKEWVCERGLRHFVCVVGGRSHLFEVEVGVVDAEVAADLWVIFGM